jgi:hypothetical protein
MQCIPLQVRGQMAWCKTVLLSLPLAKVNKAGQGRGWRGLPECLPCSMTVSVMSASNYVL